MNVVTCHMPKHAPPVDRRRTAVAGVENHIFVEDCIRGMSRLPDGHVGMVLCDLPYGTTQCAWDSPIDLEKMWEQFWRVLAAHGAVVLTAAQPFTSALVMSQPRWFRYAWVWEKSKATGYLNAKKRPLVAHEDVLVFAKRAPPYFPQMTNGKPYDKGSAVRPTDVYGKQAEVHVKNTTGLRYPRTVQYFKTAESEGRVVHPTQKPLALFRYLVRTYSQPDDLVLDACMGSGTTAVACLAEGRRFVGFESDRGIADLAAVRVRAAGLDGFVVTVP